MASITFNEPSTGEVSTNNVTALTVKVTGNDSTGIDGESVDGTGVSGYSRNKNGVVGSTGSFHGLSTLPEFSFSGVKGITAAIRGAGVWGESYNNQGNASGVLGVSRVGIGVLGNSGSNDGVHGESESGVGVLGKGKPAGRFEGDVEVTGDIKLLNPMNADCSEDFDILEESIEPGTVMVLNQVGSLQQSYKEYDRKVAGIVSGAGEYRPAMVLGTGQDSQIGRVKKNGKRLPIALIGKVFCKVDARSSPIETGDLLTTSSTKGYAMKANDPGKAFGAVIGKALGSIKEGLGMIPVLVTLQ